MTWWIWMIAGLVLLSLEMFAIDAQFYLVFLGLGALAVGLLEFFGFGLSASMQWVLFGATSLILMFTVRRHLYTRLRQQAVGYSTHRPGDVVRVDAALPPGESCRAEYRGSVWTAVNVGATTIDAGDDAVIDSIDGAKLQVKAEA